MPAAFRIYLPKNTISSFHVNLADSCFLFGAFIRYLRDQEVLSFNIAYAMGTYGFKIHSFVLSFSRYLSRFSSSVIKSVIGYMPEVASSLPSSALLQPHH